MKKIGELGLVVVLLAGAAGGFIYWQKMNTAHKPTAAPMRVASGASPFQAGQAAGSNPLRPDSAPAATPASAGTAVMTAGRTASSATAVPAAPMAANSASSALARPISTPAPAVTAPAAAAAPEMAAVASSTSATLALFNPKTQRDPMQSVGDRLMLKMFANHQKFSKEEAARLAMMAKQKNVKKAPNPATLISLEGIMTMNGTLTAIVNGGDIVSVGSKIKGAKVVAISANSVTFSYKGAGGKTMQFKKLLKH